MDADAGIKLLIAEEISRDVIVELECGFQQINRKRLAEIVFNDEAALSKLNAIVHSAVRADIGKWICNNLTTETVERPHLFIETAILMESILGVFGFSSFWTIKELFEQRYRFLPVETTNPIKR